MKKNFILLLLLFGNGCTVVNGQCSLSAPATISFTNVASCQITVNWTAVSGAAAYAVQYKLSADTQWTSLPNTGALINSCTVTGLNATTNYKIHVAAVCSNGIAGTFKQGSKKTTHCNTPANVAISNISSSSALLSWTVLCNASVFQLKYKLHSNTHWTVIPNILSPSYLLSGLSSQASYDVQVESTCGSSVSSYSPVNSFSTSAATAQQHKRLNVLLILLDDSRQDPFTPDGGPSFFKDPNITRIATEGVRFKLCFPAVSQCAPSRSSIYTGLYPHKTGVLNNSSTVNLTQTTLAEILHANNYYVGLIGKYDLSDEKQAGYDYWMENSTSVYMNAQWTVNNATKTINGHKTDVATDSAIGFLHKVPANKNFYLELAYAAPHVPYIPRPGDDTLYLKDAMPLPDNSALYYQNYPSFLYQCQDQINNETTVIRKFYQMLAGVEYSVGRVLNELTTMNILDSTLVIFTSDNGYLLDEHKLDGKRLAYEESLHLPLYMRCPPVIAPGTVIDHEISMLPDLFPTILDYLDISDTIATDGISLKKVIEGTSHRNEFFYEFFSYSCTPDIRCVRSMDHKFIQYGCNSVSEEFFDLNNDPEENANLINNSAYDSLIEVYRGKLAYWETYYQYASPDTLNNCQIINPVYQRMADEAEESDEPIFEVSPNPVSDILSVNFYSVKKLPYRLQVYNGVGQLIYDEHGTDSVIRKEINSYSMPDGNYLLIFQHGDRIFEKKLLVQQ